MRIVAVHRPETQTTVRRTTATVRLHLLHEAAIPAEEEVAHAHPHPTVAVAEVPVRPAVVEVPVRQVAEAEAVAGVADDNACLIRIM